MSHEIEFVNGKPCIAYAGEIPWHGLGFDVTGADLTPEQMMEKAGLNWTVDLVPAFTEIDGERIDINRSALVRSTDKKILDIVSNDWNPVQNLEAGEFFDEYVRAGDMTMETAGSLKGGQIVWFMAKVKESFELFGGDLIESRLLFSNFHRYGYSTDCRFTPTRVVCNNTLTMALNQDAARMVKISHRTKFVADDVKEVLGIATTKLEKYKEIAAFLGSKQAKDEDIVEYFTRIFPVSSTGSSQMFSKNAVRAFSLIENQPGAEYAEGTWWPVLNAVTYLTDHVAGRNADTRLASAWYGSNRQLKLKAVDLALEYASAA